MQTLHIEITVNDLAAFRESFDHHADLRQDAGVQAERISRVVGGAEGDLLIQLDFATGDQAEAFLVFLRTTLWPSSPVLVGSPEARVLEPLALG